MNYLFTGNPGTGKTTMARRMGTMFKALGLLPDDTVVDVAASGASLCAYEHFALIFERVYPLFTCIHPLFIRA
jgi:tRNA uridine 5-carbamoylmethylation protein Kti12